MGGCVSVSHFLKGFDAVDEVLDSRLELNDFVFRK